MLTRGWVTWALWPMRGLQMLSISQSRGGCFELWDSWAYTCDSVASNDVMLSGQKEVPENCELWSIGVMTESTARLMSVPRNPSLSIIPSTPNDRQRSKSYNCLIVIVLRLEVMISCPGLLLRDWFLISWLQLLLSWVVKDESVFIDLGVNPCFDLWDLLQSNLIFRI